MKIQTILKEDFGQQAMTAAPKIRFKDLNTLQIRTLQRIADGQVDVDSANDNEYDIMADLADLGLLDQEYQLTKSGQKAVEIAKQVGGSAELLAARKKQQSMDQFDRGGAGGDVEDIDALDAPDIDDVAGEPQEEDEFQFNLGQRR